MKIFDHLPDRFLHSLILSLIWLCGRPANYFMFVAPYTIFILLGVLPELSTLVVLLMMAWIIVIALKLYARTDEAMGLAKRANGRIDGYEYEIVNPEEDASDG